MAWWSDKEGVWLFHMVHSWVQCEMFTLVGHIQFYSTESLDKMKSIGNSLQYLVVAFSIYVGTLLVNVVHQLTRKHGGIDWLNDDINAGRLDYYYFLMAGLALINLVYILFCVKHYRYKVNVEEKVVEKLEPWGVLGKWLIFLINKCSICSE